MTNDEAERGHARPRFHDGDRLRIPGPGFDIEYRVVQGTKAADDLRLDWRIVTPYQAVCLDHVALIVDAIYENEDRLYPAPEYRGGGKVLAYVLGAVKHGHLWARHNLYLERQNRDESG